MMQEQRLSALIQPAFHETFRNIIDGSYTTIVEEGGRNSGKSTIISLALIYRLSSPLYPPVNALVLRKVGETLRESVFEQLKEAVGMLGMDDVWEFREAPLSMHNIQTGARIIFRGADKPEKIKSIKTSKIPLGILWIEELAEFRTEEELDTIVQSVIRAELPCGMQYRLIYSFNPPKRKQHWTNRKFKTQFLPPSTVVHHSTYRDNPYLSKEALEEIAFAKEHNPVKYRWVFEGETVDGGVVPFGNLEFRAVSDEEIGRFDNIRQGLDWGYAADPLAIVICHYDRTRKLLYVFDELYGVKISNESAAAWLRDRGYHRTLTTADSAEPKSIDELRLHGVRITGAVKGKGSVESGEKWLDELDTIVIDPVRCPNTAREFENASYAVDRDGKTLDRIEDKDNHTIDAVRYAVESEIGRRRIAHPAFIMGGRL